jgi:hypothetical protein
MNNPKDFMGREIKEGVTLVYPVRRLSEMWLKKLTVTRIVEILRRVQGESQPKPVTAIIGLSPVGRRITLTKASRCIIVGEN